MDIYIKTVSIAAVGVLLCLILSKNAKDYSFLLAIMICCGLCAAAAGFLKPILNLLDKLGNLSGNSNSWLPVLLKAVGLSLIGEMAGTVCSDAGYSAVGKALQVLTTLAVLWVSLPLIQSLMDLIESILEML